MPSVYQTLFGGNLVAPAIPTYLALNISANVILGWPLESNITSPAAAEIIDVTATAPALTVQLSDARQISTGYCALFNNVGANTFTLLDAQGNVLMAPASGQAWQLYLADNSTLQGTWRVFQYGAGVSSANAASLAGSGLKAITTTLNARILINQQAANYTIGSGAGQDRATCIEWTGGSGGTLTTSAAATLGSDWFCYIKNAGTGAVTFIPGSGTINGTASLSFNPNDSAILLTDGTNFVTVGFGQSLASAFNFVTISLAGASGTVVLSGANLNRVSYRFTGALAGNTIVQVPASIQQYWVDNETTGAFSLTISAGGIGSTFVVPQGSRVILYCDGLNIVNAVSTGAGSTTLVADGTAAAPGLAWASDTQMGFYKVGPDILGISTAGLQRGIIDASGRWTINAPSAGSAITINGFAGSSALLIQGAGSGTTGVDIRAGSISSDTPFVVRNAAGTTNLFLINGAGGVSALGPVAATLVDMTPDTGTFTGTGVGFTGATNFACSWTRIGKLVLLNIGAATGTSNSNGWSITGLPAAIQPTALGGQIIPLGGVVVDNGIVVTSTCQVQISSGSGSIVLLKNGIPSGWTAGGFKGLTSGGATIAYLLS